MAKILCVIPARGGSKRLPRKNILPLAGKPLLAYSIEVAQKADVFDRVLVSTDDEAIEGVARQWGADVYQRPAEFAGDNIGVMPALAELVSALQGQGETYDLVCQTLPTSIGKLPQHFREALAHLTEGFDSVVGVTAYDFPLPKALRKKGEVIEPFWPDSPLLTGTARSQDQEAFYHDNGAVYISRWESFLRYNNFYRGRVKGYEMSAWHALDIDDELDLARAEMLLEYVRRKPHSALGKLYLENQVQVTT